MSIENSGGRRIGRFVELAANPRGVTIPVGAVILAGVLTWQHLTTWRDIALDLRVGLLGASAHTPETVHALSRRDRG